MIPRGGPKFFRVFVSFAVKLQQANERGGRLYAKRLGRRLHSKIDTYRAFVQVQIVSMKTLPCPTLVFTDGKHLRKASKDRDIDDGI